MLPFLKKKQEGGMSGPIETIERKPDEGSMDLDMLDAIAEDFLDAIASKNKSLLKSSLEALCEHIQDMDEEQDSKLMHKE